MCRNLRELHMKSQPKRKLRRMTRLRLPMVLRLKWLIVMMRVMIRLTPTHMKIIFNRCNII
jgi:hypothetical protein